MPTYEFKCNKCHKKFSEIMSFSEHGRKKVKCPKCSSVKTEQLVTSFSVETSKKS